MSGIGTDDRRRWQALNVLCVGIFFSIVLFGHLFGANMWGLLPLGACVPSGIFIWAKDLIKHGRDFEWKSEQDQGETATANLIPESVEVGARRTSTRTQRRGIDWGRTCCARSSRYPRSRARR